MSEKKQKKVWFRPFDGWWYVYLGKGRRRRAVRLAQGENNRKQAVAKYRTMLADGSVEELDARAKVKAVCVAFLKRHSKKECSPDTHRWYRFFLKSFCRKHGSLRVADLRPLEVKGWLDGKPTWGETTRNRALTCLNVALNWAVDMGILKRNPIKSMKKGSVLPRERIVTPEERRLILAAVKDRAFKLVLFAMGSPGARPSEIRRVSTAEFLPAGMWVFPPRKHKTGKKTRRPRVVYLTPPMVKLCRKLAEKYPEGPLFRNTRGKPWTANALRCRFRRLRDKFPALQGVTAYCYRHSYTTEGLLNGVPLAQMQELLGHTSPAMMRHYSHLGQKAAAMQEAAARATHPQTPSRPRLPESRR